VNTSPKEISRTQEKIFWHITVDLAYEGKDDNSGQDQVRKVLSALSPLIENGKDFKQIFINRFPEKG
jgi:hypothetical protein